MKRFRRRRQRRTAPDGEQDALAARVLDNGLESGDADLGDEQPSAGGQDQVAAYEGRARGVSLEGDVDSDNGDDDAAPESGSGEDYDDDALPAQDHELTQATSQDGLHEPDQGLDSKNDDRDDEVPGERGAARRKHAPGKAEADGETAEQSSGDASSHHGNKTSPWKEMTIPKFATHTLSSWCYWILFSLTVLAIVGYALGWAVIWVLPSFDYDDGVLAPTGCTSNLLSIATASAETEFLWLNQCANLSSLEGLLERSEKITARTFAGQIFVPGLVAEPTLRDIFIGSYYEVPSCYDSSDTLRLILAMLVCFFPVFIALAWVGEVLHEEKEAQLLRPILDAALLLVAAVEFAALPNGFRKFFGLSSTSEKDSGSKRSGGRATRVANLSAALREKDPYKSCIALEEANAGKRAAEQDLADKRISLANCREDFLRASKEEDDLSFAQVALEDARVELDSAKKALDDCRERLRTHRNDFDSVIAGMQENGQPLAPQSTKQGTQHGKKLADYAVQMVLFANEMVLEDTLFWEGPPHERACGFLWRWLASCGGWCLRVLCCCRHRRKPEGDADDASKMIPRLEAYPYLKDTGPILDDYVRNVLFEWAAFAFIFYLVAFVAGGLCLVFGGAAAAGSVKRLLYEPLPPLPAHDCARLSDFIAGTVSFAGACLPEQDLRMLLRHVEIADIKTGPFYPLQDVILDIDGRSDGLFHRLYAQAYLCAAHPHWSRWGLPRAALLIVAMLGWLGFFVYSRRPIRWKLFPFVGIGYDMGWTVGLYLHGCVWMVLFFSWRCVLRVVKPLWRLIWFVAWYPWAAPREKKVTPKKDEPDDPPPPWCGGAEDGDGATQTSIASWLMSTSRSMVGSTTRGKGSEALKSRRKICEGMSNWKHVAAVLVVGMVVAAAGITAALVCITVLLPMPLYLPVAVASLTGFSALAVAGEVGALVSVSVALGVAVLLATSARFVWRRALPLSPRHCAACAKEHHRYRFWQSCPDHYCRRHDFFMGFWKMSCPGCEALQDEMPNKLCNCPGRARRLRVDCPICWCEEHKILKVTFGSSGSQKICLKCDRSCPRHPNVFRDDCECYCQVHRGMLLEVRAGKSGCASCFCDKLEHHEVKRDVATEFCPLCVCKHDEDRNRCQICSCLVHLCSKAVVCGRCGWPHVGNDRERPRCNARAPEDSKYAARVCMSCDFGCEACRADPRVPKNSVGWKEACEKHWCARHGCPKTPDVGSEDDFVCEICASPCKFCTSDQVPELRMHSRTGCHGPPGGPRWGHFCVEHGREAPANDGCCVICSGTPECPYHDEDVEEKRLTRRECADLSPDEHWCFATLHAGTNDDIAADGGVDLATGGGRMCPICLDPCSRCPEGRKRGREACREHFCVAHARYKEAGVCDACSSPCKDCAATVGPGGTIPKDVECTDKHFCAIHRRAVNKGRPPEAHRDDGRCLLCTDPCRCGHPVPLMECSMCFCSRHERSLCNLSQDCAQGYCQLCTCAKCGRRRKDGERPIRGRCERCSTWCDHDKAIDSCVDCWCSDHHQPRMMKNPRRRTNNAGAADAGGAGAPSGGARHPCPECISCGRPQANGSCTNCYCGACGALLAPTGQWSADTTTEAYACTRCNLVPLPLTRKRFCKLAAKLYNCLGLARNLPRELQDHWNRHDPLTWKDLELQVVLPDMTQEKNSVSLFVQSGLSSRRQGNEKLRRRALVIQGAIHALVNGSFEGINLATGDRTPLRTDDTSPADAEGDADARGDPGQATEFARWHPWFWRGINENAQLARYEYGRDNVNGFEYGEARLEDAFKTDQDWWPSDRPWAEHEPLADVLTEHDLKELAGIAMEVAQANETSPFRQCAALGLYSPDRLLASLEYAGGGAADFLREELAKAKPDCRRYRENLANPQTSPEADSSSYRPITAEAERFKRIHVAAERARSEGLVLYTFPVDRPASRRATFTPPLGRRTWADQLSSGSFATGPAAARRRQTWMSPPAGGLPFHHDDDDDDDDDHDSYYSHS